MVPALGSPTPPPPPQSLPQQQPPPTPVLETLAAAANSSATAPSPSGDGVNPSLLVVGSIILFVVVASASIHLLLRFISGRSPSFSSSSGISAPLRRRLSSSSSSSSSPAAAGGHRDEEALIDSLPLFTLASSLAALPRSSPDCAVCLSRFNPDDRLRLLPSCCHAFHSTCIDTWLRSNLSCPLCRSPILREPLPPPPLPPPPTRSAPTAPTPQPQATSAGESTNTAALPAAAGSDRSGSYRIEIGSVSRRSTVESDGPALPQNARSYSLGSSFEYVVDEEVEAVVSALAAHVRQQRRKEHNKDPSDGGPATPGEDVAEAAGGGSRSWLRDYLDRLASSASSSFSSLRFSGRSSRRTESSVAGAGGGSWDLEGNRRWPGEEDEIAGAYNAFCRWLAGV